MRERSEPVTAVLSLRGRSVKELARRVIREIEQADCLGRAAQLAYYFLFALFPFGSIWIPGSYVSKSSSRSPNKALPRRLTL